MIKLILGLIALIVIALTTYIFTNPKNGELSKHIVTTQQAEKIEVPSKQIETAVIGAKVTRISSQPTIKKYTQTTKKMVKQVSQHISNNTIEDDENKIGEDFMLDTIEDKDIDDEEKERIRDHIIYFQEIHVESFESTSK